MPDREARVQTFFFDVAEALPERSLLLGPAQGVRDHRCLGGNRPVSRTRPRGAGRVERGRSSRTSAIVETRSRAADRRRGEAPPARRTTYAHRAATVEAALLSTGATSKAMVS